MIDFVEQKYETKRTFPPKRSMLRGGNTLKAKALHICGKSYEENRSLTRLGLYGDYVV